MIYEMVHLTVDPARRDEFIDAYKAAWNAAAFEGSHRGKVMRSIEDETRVDVLIEWDSVEAHRQHRGSAKQAAFRAAIDPFKIADSKIQHFEFEELVP